MSTQLVLLMGLLLTAYLGSFLVGGRALKGFGLPSNVEWVVLGFVLGPALLDVIGTSLFEAVEPALVVGIGWLALCTGLDFGHARDKWISPGRLASSVVSGAVTATLVGTAVYYVVPFVYPEIGEQRMTAAIVLAAVATETTRNVMRWARERHGAQGPLLDLLTDLADVEDLIPIGALAVLFAMHTPSALGLPLGVRIAAPFVLGGVIGVLSALLLGREFRLRESWGVVLGMGLLGAGVTARIGGSTIPLMFAVGLAMSLASRHAPELRAMVLPTERSVLLPLLILVGAHLPRHPVVPLLVLVAVTALVRVASKGLFGAVLSRVDDAARPAGTIVGLGLTSSGALSVCVALAFERRFPGPVGDAGLAVATGLCIAGELVGPPSLRVALRRAGELGATPSARASSAPEPPKTPEEAT